MTRAGVGSALSRRRALAVGGALAGSGSALAAACGTSRGTPSSARSDRSITLDVLVGTASTTEQLLQQLRDGFRAAHPNVTLNETPTQGTTVTPQKVLTLVAGGTPPDVTPLHPAFITDLAEKGLLADLGPLAAKDKSVDLPDFYSGPLDHFRNRGTLHGLPWYSGPTVIYFNRSLLDRLGVKAPDQREREGKWDWNALREVTRAATQGSGETRTMGMQSVNTALDWMDAWFWQAGGDVFSKDLKRCLLADPAVVAAAQYLADLHLKDRIIPTGPDAKDFSGGVEAGKIALRVGIKDQAAGLTQKAAETNFTVGMAPTPKGAATRANRDGPQAYGFLTSTKEPEAAFAYVRYMTGPESQRLRLAAKLTTPVRKSAARLPEYARSLDPWEVAEWWTEASTTTRPLPKPPRYPDINKIWQDAWAKILAGDVAVRPALEEAARQIDPLLAGG
jgi:multiple sugar transport system substrate-binding protein